MRVRDLVVAISGLHGTGKSTYASIIATEYRLRHISAGELFRQIAVERKLSLTELSRETELNEEVDHLLDQRTRREIARGGVVVDGLLAGWMAREYSALKIYLLAPYEVRIERIAARDGLSHAEAKKVTRLRERIEKRRFKRRYGIDIDDLSIYDLVLNTGLLPIQSNIEVIKSFVNECINSRGK